MALIIWYMAMYLHLLDPEIFIDDESGRIPMERDPIFYEFTMFTDSLRTSTAMLFYFESREMV